MGNSLNAVPNLIQMRYNILHNIIVIQFLCF